MSAPRRRPGTMQEDVPGTGETVLLDRESGRVLALNPTGAAVWDLLDGRREAEEIAAALAEAGGAPRDEALAHVQALLERLSEEGFLEGPSG